MRQSARSVRRIVAAALTAITAGAVGASSASGGVIPAPRHTELLKSQPAAGDTVGASPDTLRFWFSESVQLPVTRIRVTRPGHTPRLGKPVVRVVSGAETVVVAVEDKLAPGLYTVIWKTAGPDGHPSVGTFTFVVRAHR